MTAPQPPQNAQRQQADTAELARRNQQRAADPRRSVWVSASAGSGKTKVLTDRVLRLLLNGVAPQRLLALTFSKAGAAEMANRVNARLAHWAVMAPAVLESDLRGLGEPGDAEQCRRARRLFARVLDLPAGLAIETIHAFCQRLLGRFPLEAGVAANFSVIDEVEGNRLLAEARDSLLVSAQRDGGDAARWVAEVALHSAEDQFTTLLGNLLGARQRLRDWITGLGGPAQLEAHFAARLGLDIAGAGGTHSDAALIQQFLTQEDQAWPELRRLVTACEAAPTKRVTDHLAPLLAWRERNDRDRAATLGDYTGFFLKSGSIEPYSIGHMLPKKAREAQPEIVQTYLSRAAACQALRLEQNKRDLLRCNVALFRLADAMISRFEQKKAASAQLDFDDLIAKTEALLRQPGGSAWVSFKLDSAISHVLVDES